MKPAVSAMSSSKAPAGRCRARRGTSAIVVTGLFAGAACHAQTLVDRSLQAAIPRIEWGTSITPAPGAAPERSQTHMTLWLSRDGSGVGVGRVEPTVFGTTAATPPSTATWAPNASWTWSLRQDLGRDSRLVVEQVYAPGQSFQNSPRDVRLALELKPNDALKRYGVSRDSLLRVPLSGTWTLAMRPRSGGMALTLRTPL